MHFSSRPVPRRQNSPPSFLGLRPFRNVCFHTGTDLQNHRTHVLYTYNHKVYLIYISHRSLTVNAQILCGKMYDLRHRKTIYNNKTTELAQLEENAIEKKAKALLQDYGMPTINLQTLQIQSGSLETLLLSLAPLLLSLHPVLLIPLLLLISLSSPRLIPSGLPPAAAQPAYYPQRSLRWH